MSGNEPAGGVSDSDACAELALIRAALLPQPRRLSFVAQDGDEFSELVPAAVLFPIVLTGAAPCVLLTRRTDHLKDHPGQISFPGGRMEPGDLSPAHTALREAEEEIGLAPEKIELVGYLPDFHVVRTGYCVTPVVGFIRPPLDLQADPFEVESILEVPLGFLLDTGNHQQHTVEVEGRVRRYHAMQYGEHFIWGATAGMIVSLCKALNLAPATSSP